MSTDEVELVMALAALSEVVEAARDYVLRSREAHEATGRDLTEAWIARDWSFHELIAALGEECWLCDEGSCPTAREVVLYHGREVVDTPGL